MLPDRTKSTFSFKVEADNSCGNPTITAPNGFTSEHFYYIGAAANSYNFPDFTVSDGCSIDTIFTYISKQDDW